MASLTISADGIQLTIDPAYQPTRPGAVFSIGREGGSLLCNTPVTSISFRSYGILVNITNPFDAFRDATIRAVGVNGQVVSARTYRAAREETIVFSASPSNPIQRIFFDVPFQLSFGNFELRSIYAPPPNTPPTEPPDDEPPTYPIPNVNLADYIFISKPLVEREYVKDTMLPIPPESFTVRNTSPNIDINVRLRGAGGVTFDPSTFSLAPREDITVRALFDPSGINALPTGKSRITCVVDLTSQTVLRPPVLPWPPPQTIPEPPPSTIPDVTEPIPDPVAPTPTPTPTPQPQTSTGGGGGGGPRTRDDTNIDIGPTDERME